MKRYAVIRQSLSFDNESSFEVLKTFHDGQTAHAWFIDAMKMVGSCTEIKEVAWSKFVAPQLRFVYSLWSETL